MPQLSPQSLFILPIFLVLVSLFLISSYFFSSKKINDFKFNNKVHLNSWSWYSFSVCAPLFSA